jgi:hypothetical protein
MFCSCLLIKYRVILIALFVESLYIEIKFFCNRILNNPSRIALVNNRIADYITNLPRLENFEFNRESEFSLNPCWQHNKTKLALLECSFIIFLAIYFFLDDEG